MDELNNGERQVAPTLDGIRRDHRARYEWAAKNMPPASRVIDLACGVGYGAKILADAGHRVLAVDRSEEAIAFARQHYAGAGIVYKVADAETFTTATEFDAAVSFETIEHLADPGPMLRGLRDRAAVLYASVPNEAVFPFRSDANGYAGYRHHHRHYTRDEFAGLLWGTGWSPSVWCGQEGTESDVDEGVDGRTLVVIAERAAMPADAPAPAAELVEGRPAPRHVAIVGLGPSAEAYMDRAKRAGSRHAIADEVWAINAIGDVIQCDMVFHMDDVRIQEIRATARPDSNIARMLTWLRTTGVPVMTSIPSPDYPSSVAFPLDDVVNKLGRGYFNNTAAYAVAYAICIGVKKISLFGCDYTYPNAHKAEKGRACLEFWLGYATAHGIEIALPQNTSLMDAIEDVSEDDVQAYGYDAVRIACERADDGTMKLTMTPRDRLPTAEEIEAAYDHGRPPAAQHSPGRKVAA